jgi:PhoPQ-activated pathogenicity-related protein
MTKVNFFFNLIIGSYIYKLQKAVKRGMDIVQGFSKRIRVQTPQKFILSGISKRGWTSWLAAAVDTKRVIGFIPIVFDFIDINKVCFKKN